MTISMKYLFASRFERVNPELNPELKPWIGMFTTIKKIWIFIARTYHLSVHSPCVIILVCLYENASRLFKPYPGPCFFNFSQLIKRSTGNHECKHDYVSKREAGTSSNSVMFVKVKKSTMKKTEVMSSCRMRTGVPCVQKPFWRRLRLKSCSVRPRSRSPRWCSALLPLLSFSLLLSQPLR